MSFFTNARNPGNFFRQSEAVVAAIAPNPLNNQTWVTASNQLFYGNSSHPPRRSRHSTGSKLSRHTAANVKKNLFLRGVYAIAVGTVEGNGKGPETHLAI